VCYAEKVAPKEVIPHMSKVKSPQQIMGNLLRDSTKEKLYVVGIMPCYDKKLEAIRFSDSEGQKEVDLVLASNEIVDLINRTEAGPKCNCEGNSCSQCSCKKEIVEELFPYNKTIE
jgi:iron only hydrogenase large subunit-like protein